jgi:hypothetical protein
MRQSLHSMTSATRYAPHSLFILPHHILTLFGPKLRASIAHQVKDGPREVYSFFNPLSNFSFNCLQIEVLSWTTRTALELIGQSGLGYSFDSLTEDGVPHPYSTTVKLFSYVYFPRIMGLSSDFADNHTQGQLYSRWRLVEPISCPHR